MRLHRKAATWIKEVIHVTHGTIVQNVFEVNKEPPQHYLGYVVAGKVPVILLPGIGGTWGYMKKLGDEISLRGHPVYIVRQLDVNLFDIPKSARLVQGFLEALIPKYHRRLPKVKAGSEAIAEIIEKNNLEQAIVVAHSKGGLIGKYYLIHYNTPKRVIGLIALATPFSGSSLAKIIPHAAYQELKADSEIIHDLQTHQEVNKEIISIYPEFDNLVWAPQGSYLENAQENIELPIGGHNLLFRNKTVFAVVIEKIDQITAKLDPRHKTVKI